MFRKLVYFYLICFVLVLSGNAWADTVAYWRFEGPEPNEPNVVCTENPYPALPDINGLDGWDSGLWRKAVHDWSGNGNHMTTWEHNDTWGNGYGWASWRWDANVPAAIVAFTGASNTLSIAHTEDMGEYPACMTWSAQSSPNGIDIEEIEPNQFTIEASFYMTVGPTGASGYRTVVGRDAQGVDPGNGNNAALYFQRRPGGVAGFLFCDVSGYFHMALSDPCAIVVDTWYNMVAVSDGNTMSLYLADVEAGRGFQLVAQTDMTASGSPNTALTNGKSADPNTGTDWHAATWTVGRGLYDDGHTDRFYGYIDEVRISDTALKQSQFLFQQWATEPNPPDGSETSTSIVLSWDPIPWATGHDVYFGTDYNDVNDATRSVTLGVLEKQNHDSNSYLVSSLTPEETYYWRIDEVEGVVVGPKGPVWSLTVTPLKASEPSPYIGEICVLYDPCAVLSWAPGVHATQSELYFGTSSGSLVWEANIPHTGLERYSYGKTGLSPDTDYYWRVDEVNGLNKWPGDEWHFKTIPIITPPDDPNLVGWWKFDEGQDKAIDWSGLDQHGTVYGGTAPIDGFVGEGISLDGEDGYVELPIGTTISTLGSATVATWVNFEDSGTWWQRIFDFGISDSNGYMFLTPRGNPNGVFRFAISLTNYEGESVVAASSALPSGWHHVAVVIAEPNQMQLYLDGTVVDSGETLVLPKDLNNTTNNWLGRSQYATDAYFSGSLDEFRIYNRALSQAEIKEIMAPDIAWWPRPADGSGGAQTDTTLIWEPGKDANEHDIYFGTDETAVTDANLTVQLGVLAEQGYDSNSYGPLALDYETTYYWRIDEVNGPNTWKGDVWSFTTEPNITPADPNLLCWLKFDDAGGSTAIDSSGHSNHGTIVGGASWGSGMLQGALEFDGTDDYVDLPIGEEVNSMSDLTIATWVNFSNAGGAWQRIFDFGNDTNEYMFLTPRIGTDGVMRFGITITSNVEQDNVDAPTTLASDWRHVAVMIDSNTIPYTLKLYLDGAEVGLNPLGDILPSDLGVTTNNWLGRSQWTADGYLQASLDDFRIYNKLLTEQELRELVSPPWAWVPNPPDNETDVKAVPKPILSWLPGNQADKHDVYLGTDEAAVTDANRSNPLGVLVSENQDACSYDPCEIDFDTAYYWRVDEVNMSIDPNIFRGDVWSFTTSNYVEIDHFNRYSSRDEVRAVWEDGYETFENGSNITLSTVIDPRYPAGHQAEGPIHQGSNALQFVYDNNKDDFIWIYTPGYEPYYYTVFYYFSEMKATVDDLGCVSDWTTAGVKLLTLQFSGDPDNDIGPNEQMYIALEDGEGNIAVVKYGDSNGEDANNLKSRAWTEWAIDLLEFETVNASFNIEDVNKVYIGFGERYNNTTAGGSGVVYIDSIWLDWPKCVPAMAPASDLSDDCTTDLFDFILLADSWDAELSTAVPIIDLNASTVAEGEVLSWTNSAIPLGGNFDVNFADVNDRPWRETIDDLPAVTFDGNDYLIADFNAPGGITGANDFTVITTVFNPTISAEEVILAWARRDGPASTSGAVGYGTDPSWGAVIHWNEGGEEPDMGFDGGVPAFDMWHEIAVTYDGVTEKVLVDGKLNAAEGSKILDIYADDPVVVGAGYWWDFNDVNDPNDPNDFINTTLHFSGSVNRIRVYDEALSQAQLEFMATSSYSADLDGDGDVDFKDLAMMLDEWLKEKLFP